MWEPMLPSIYLSIPVLRRFLISLKSRWPNLWRHLHTSPYDDHSCHPSCPSHRARPPGPPGAAPWAQSGVGGTTKRKQFQSGSGKLGRNEVPEKVWTISFLFSWVFFCAVWMSRLKTISCRSFIGLHPHSFGQSKCQKSKLWQNAHVGIPKRPKWLFWVQEGGQIYPWVWHNDQNLPWGISVYQFWAFIFSAIDVLLLRQMCLM